MNIIIITASPIIFPYIFQQEITLSVLNPIVTNDTLKWFVYFNLLWRIHDTRFISLKSEWYYILNHITLLFHTFTCSMITFKNRSLIYGWRRLRYCHYVRCFACQIILRFSKRQEKSNFHSWLLFSKPVKYDIREVRWNLRNKFLKDGIV